MDERGSPEVIRLFPSFVWKTRLGSDARAVVRGAILGELGALRAGADPEAGQVWQSRHGLHVVPALEPLVRHVRLGVEQVLEFLHVGTAPFEITGLWVNVAAPGGMVRMHNHPNNFLNAMFSAYAETMGGPLWGER